MASRIRITYAEVAASVNKTELEVSVSVPDIRASVSAVEANADIAIPFATTSLTFIYPRALSSSTYVQAIAVIDPDTLNRYFRDDAVTFTDLPVFVFSKALADAASIGEQHSVDLAKPFSESVSFVDNASVVMEFVRTPTDAISVAEAKSLLVQKPFSDTASILESATITHGKAVTDVVSVAETLSRNTSKALVDNAAISEILARVVTYNRTFSDSFTLDDFTDVDAISKQTNGHKTNVFSVSETHAMSLTKSIADSVSISESLAVDLNRSLSDSLSMSESVSIELLSGESSVLNQSALNAFTLNS